MNVRVMTAHQHGQLAIAVGYLEPVRQRLDQCDSGFLVTAVARQNFLWCQRFAQIVSQHGVAHGSRCADAGRVAQRQHRVHTGIDLGMPLRRLWHAVQGIELREDHAQRTATAERLEIDIRPRLTERAFGLLPDPLRDERVDLTGSGDLCHQLAGLIGDSKAEIGVARGKARDPEDPHGILHEAFRHMTQQTRLEVTAATVRIDDLAG